MSWVDVLHRLDVWVDITPVPSWEEAGWDNQKEWAKSTADTILTLRHQPYRWLPLRRLSKAIIRSYDAHARHQIGMRTYLHMTDDAQASFAVSLGYFPAEGDRTRALRRLTRADDPDLLRPPQLDTFHAGHLGEGLKALGHVVLDDGEIVANLWYAFRDETHQVDVVVFASTGDLVRLGEVVPDIEALVHGIKVRADDEEGWWAGVADDIPADVDG